MLKNIIGFSVIIKYIIVNNILKPSQNVLSFECEPSGLLKYLAGTSPTGKRICKAYIVSSVSISNPLEAAGIFFTNLRKKLI